ncbi:discoidin domain-containing protein [Cohnella silvisoli]|nr:discoidin domain-containing protein [Cohnella silvisoli]
MSRTMLICLMVSIMACVAVTPAVAFANETVSEIITLENGKKVISVGGEPYITDGVQIRTDSWRRYAGLTNAQMSDKGLFRWARLLNVNVVQVPVAWREVEPSQNVFDYTNVAWSISEAKKYGLKMELLWFGSDVGGSAWSEMIPDYLTNTAVYDRILKSDGSILGAGYSTWGDGNKIALSREDPDTHAAEENAINHLMDYLESNDPDDVVIGIQVQNEPTIMQHQPTMAETDRDYSAASNSLYTAGGYTNAVRFSEDRLAIYLNRVAGWFKNSTKKMFTRVNFISPYTSVDEDITKMRNLAPNVDFIGYDTYGVNQATLYNRLTNYFSTGGNLPHLSEQDGSAADSRQKIIDVLAANGAGAEIYRLAMATVTTDIALLDVNGKDNYAHTQEVRSTFGMLNKALFYLTLRKNNNSTNEIQYYNAEGTTLASSSTTLPVAGFNIKYDTSNAGIGIAFTEDLIRRNRIALMSAKSGTFTFEGEIIQAESGMYDSKGSWMPLKNKELTDNGNGTYAIAMNPYEVVRLSVAPNLALNQSATMSTANYSGHPASHANDGSTSTYAQSNSDVPWDMTLDLGAAKSFDRVVLRPNTSNYASQYAIKVSNDQINWTTVATETSGNGTPKTYNFMQTSGRYVWIDVTAEVGGGAGWGHAIHEIGIYDKDDEAQEANLVSGATASMNTTAYAGRPAANAIDGDEATGAISNSNTPWDLTIDLGSARTFDRFVLTTGNELDAGGTNIAIGKTAVMNTTAYSGHPASAAIDGNSATYAQSNSDVPWDLTVDLGSAQMVNKVVVKPDSGGYASQYTIQTSTDNVIWTTVATETTGTGSAKAYSFGAVSARYVKLDVTVEVGGGASWGHAVREFEIYNEPTQGYAKDYEVLVSSDNTIWTSVAVVANAYGEPGKIIDFIPVTARYVKLDVTSVNGGGANSGHEIRELGIYDMSSANLAKQAMLMYSGTGYSFPLIGIKDGDLGSSFVSSDSPSFPQYVTFDFGRARAFSQIKLFTAYAQGQGLKNWNIEVSSDNTNWSSVYASGDVSWSTNNDTREMKLSSFTAQNKRYVRLKINAAYTTWSHYAISEIEINP